MHSVYSSKARYYTRKAWMALGKAREAKFNAVNGTNPFIQELDRAMLKHHIMQARMTMHTALVYRQIDGRL
jgi:hypothetical protein